MTHTTLRILTLALAFAVTLPFNAGAADGDSTSVGSAVVSDTSADSSSTNDGGRTYLVPELENAGYRIKPGRKAFKHRLSFSPAIGQLGNQDYFAFRLGYNPNSWLGYEFSLGHNPASGLHALLHTFNVQLRYPIPWRTQPYATIGYGMMTVYPGRAINADPVSRNTLTTGGGLEFYIREDVALRGEIRGVTLFGSERDSDETVTYSYREYTIGFTFYRSLGQ